MQTLVQNEARPSTALVMPEWDTLHQRRSSYGQNLATHYQTVRTSELEIIPDEAAKGNPVFKPRTRRGSIMQKTDVLYQTLNFKTPILES